MDGPRKHFLLLQKFWINEGFQPCSTNQGILTDQTMPERTRKQSTISGSSVPGLMTGLETPF
jgi:hypothetical protein